MSTTREKSFDRNISALDGIFEFIAEFVSTFGIVPAVSYTLQFAIEEVFTNLVKYDLEAEASVSIRMEKNDNRIIVTIVNAGGRFFDMTAQTDSDNRPYDRRAGGLGLYLVRKMVDEFHYAYTDGTGIITIVVSLEG